MHSTQISARALALLLTVAACGCGSDSSRPAAEDAPSAVDCPAPDVRARDLSPLPADPPVDPEAVAPGPVAAIIYTHSHVDHVGGATAWADDDTEIWATDAFSKHFAKQYGRFAPAEAYRALAATVGNTNGRAWLLQAALQLERGAEPRGRIQLNDRLVEQLPVELVFDVLPARLDVAATAEVETAATISLGSRLFSLVIRRGIAEVREGEALPGSPPAAVSIETDELTWKRVALGLTNPAAAVAAGDLKVDDLSAAVRVLGYFRAGA